MDKIKIWTLYYSPFVMGGDVNQPIATEVVPTERHQIKQNLHVYVVKSPTGKTHVVDGITGGMIATSMEELWGLIEGCTEEQLVTQCKSQQSKADSAKMLTPSEFWSRFRD